MFELRDLTGVTEEEVDASSIEAVVEDGIIIFDKSTYVVENGVMLFERPLKVDLYDLDATTPDRVSITKSFNNTWSYVYAISQSKEYNWNLIEFAKRNNRIGKKYKLFVSYSSEEEVYEID